MQTETNEYLSALSGHIVNQQCESEGGLCGDRAQFVPKQNKLNAYSLSFRGTGLTCE